MKTFYVVCVVFVISRGGIMKRNARTSAPARKMNVASYEENLSAIIPELNWNEKEILKNDKHIHSYVIAKTTSRYDFIDEGNLFNSSSVLIWSRGDGSSCYTGKLLHLHFLKHLEDSCRSSRLKIIYEEYFKTTPSLHAKFEDDIRH